MPGAGVCVQEATQRAMKPASEEDVRIMEAAVRRKRASGGASRSRSPTPQGRDDSGSNSSDSLSVPPEVGEDGMMLSSSAGNSGDAQSATSTATCVGTASGGAGKCSTVGDSYIHHGFYVCSRSGGGGEPPPPPLPTTDAEAACAAWREAILVGARKPSATSSASAAAQPSKLGKVPSGPESAADRQLRLLSAEAQHAARASAAAAQRLVAAMQDESVDDAELDRLEEAAEAAASKAAKLAERRASALAAHEAGRRCARNALVDALEAEAAEARAAGAPAPTPREIAAMPARFDPPYSTQCTREASEALAGCRAALAGCQRKADEYGAEGGAPGGAVGGAAGGAGVPVTAATMTQRAVFVASEVLLSDDVALRPRMAAGDASAA